MAKLKISLRKIRNWRKYYYRRRNLHQLIKALEVDQYNSVPNIQGAYLQVESLESVMKSVTFP
jgi:hypothetical protein